MPQEITTSNPTLEQINSPLLNTSNSITEIPSPFKKHLFYLKPLTTQKRTNDEKAPRAISSDKWRAFIKKDHKKAEILFQKQKNKQERAKKKKLMKENFKKIK